MDTSIYNHLQFNKVISFIKAKCLSNKAIELCDTITPKQKFSDVENELNQVQELKTILAASLFFPSVEHFDVEKELTILSLDGGILSGGQLLKVCKTTEVINTLVKYLKGKLAIYPNLYALSDGVEANDFLVNEINRIIDFEGNVKSSASLELQKVRKAITEKRRESDRKFYNFLNDAKKLGFVRDNDEGFFNGRRTIAVLVDYKTEVGGLIHSKSESGKTLFIEPSGVIQLNNEIDELVFDEQREVNRLLRELCNNLQPFSKSIKRGLNVLIYVDFVKAKALFAIDIKGTLPLINDDAELNITKAYHPLLFLQNKKLNKQTIPLNLKLNTSERLLLVSGPNAGGKTVVLKTVGLLQLMLQSGLLIPVNESSSFCFFEEILVDIGDEQSIENELSTYSSKLKSMKKIIAQANENCLVLMDEFGSGTDPELGGAIAEAVFESLSESKCKGIITSHFGNVKLLAEKLEGAFNGCMLFDSENFEPRFVLSVGEPGSSYTFEVAEKVGFPKHLIEKAKLKVDTDKLKLGSLLAEVQQQKTLLEDKIHQVENEEFLKRMAKEKYNVLFNTWQEKMNNERDRKIELAKLASFGERYLRLMNDWNEKQDKKLVIKRFIDGITAETKKQELLKKQKKLDSFAEKKIERLKPLIKIGSKVKVLNGSEIGTVEEINNTKVIVNFGKLKMTVGLENLVLSPQQI